MPKMSWTKMLKQWSDAIIASGEFSDLIPAESAAKNWAGFPPATEAEIRETERRLGRQLPHSYRQFLRVSNGWFLKGTLGAIRLWSVQEIKPMSESEPEIVRIWSKGKDYDEDFGNPACVPNSHFKQVIQISEDNDGLYFLNPLIEPVSNEWQAAFFAAWVPGAGGYDSFESLMSQRFQAYMSAHPLEEPARNLAKPPDFNITDPNEFIDQLRRLDFFKYASLATSEKMVREFLLVHKQFNENQYRMVDGPYASPGAVILQEESGRVVNLSAKHLTANRGLYALKMARQLLASAGIELGVPEEIVSNDSYRVRLEGIEHEYFRLRNGMPTKSGGNEFNIARFVLYETAKLLNKVLKQRKHKARISTLEELQTQLTGKFRLAMVLLDDDLSYLLQWTPVIHNYCRPVRPDVFR